MQIDLRERDYGPCPYLEDRRWRVQEFSAAFLEPGLYEALLAEGWRRSGATFYRDVCPGCRLCVPIRLDSLTFTPSRSQRRVARLNEDIGVEVVEADFSEERFALYRSYVRARHSAGREEAGAEDVEIERASYAAFLLGGPLRGEAGGGSRIVEYRDAAGSLVATGYVDFLPDGLSSVYFAFEPGEARRSLGTWSVLRELELAREAGKRYYYLGFWVPGSPKMDYKASFRPFERAADGSWILASDRREALAAMGTR